MILRSSCAKKMRRDRRWLPRQPKTPALASLYRYVKRLIWAFGGGGGAAAEAEQKRNAAKIKSLAKSVKKTVTKVVKAVKKNVKRVVKKTVKKQVKKDVKKVSGS